MDYSTYMVVRLKTKNCLNPPKLTYPPGFNVTQHWVVMII